MMRLFIVAIRNVLRNRRRSFFNGLAMTVGVGFVVFLVGFFNGFIASVIRGSIDAGLGAVQIHRHGFLDAQQDPLKRDMPADPEFMRRLRAVAGVVEVSPRINFEGLLNNGEQANIVMGLGIDPVLEYIVCPQRKTFEVDGSLEGGDQVLLGAELARSLELKPGSAATLLGATQTGSSNALDVTVRGRVESPVPFASKRTAVVSLAHAQRLLAMPGRVTEYAVRVDDLDRAPEVAAALQRVIGDEFEAITWDQRDAAAKSFVSRLRGVRLIISAILMVLVLTFIVNTMLSAVYERVREIGTMLAVGVRRRQVLLMFLCEAAALGALASAAGSLIGALVISWLHSRGILLQPPGAKPSMVYPFVTPLTLVASVSLSMLGAALAALYPAFKASRLRPVEALRSN